MISRYDIDWKVPDNIGFFISTNQTGHSKGKYKSANFKKFLLSICDKSINEQQLLLSKEFDSWKGDLEQIDDVCVMGVRI